MGEVGCACISHLVALGNLEDRCAKFPIGSTQSNNCINLLLLTDVFTYSGLGPWLKERTCHRTLSFMRTCQCKEIDSLSLLCL